MPRNDGSGNRNPHAGWVAIALGLVDQIRRFAADHEAAERAAVYVVAAEWVAGELKVPEQATLRALYELCGESPDSPLWADAPVPDRGVSDRVAAALVRFTVTYRAPADRHRCTRAVDMRLDRDGAGREVRATAEAAIGWENIPDEARAAIIGGEQAVTFNLLVRQ